MRGILQANIYLSPAAEETDTEFRRRVTQQTAYIADAVEPGDDLAVAVNGKTIHCTVQEVTK